MLLKEIKGIFFRLYSFVPSLIRMKPPSSYYLSEIPVEVLSNFFHRMGK
jgi:hypothetical protein